MSKLQIGRRWAKRQRAHQAMADGLMAVHYKGGHGKDLWPPYRCPYYFVHVPKLKIKASEINSIAKKRFEMKVNNYFVDEMKRAVILAKQAGFRNFNDCIHTAIAETYCSEIITYNKKYFTKICRAYTDKSENFVNCYLF